MGCGSLFGRGPFVGVHMRNPQGLCLGTGSGKAECKGRNDRKFGDIKTHDILRFAFGCCLNSGFFYETKDSNVAFIRMGSGVRPVNSSKALTA